MYVTMAHTPWLVVSLLVLVRFNFTNQCSSFLRDEHLQQTNESHSITINVTENVTLACNRSHVESAVNWHVYTKETEHILINARFSFTSLSYLIYNKVDDGTTYTLTLGNFSASVGDYFVVCSVESNGGCYRLHPIKPYIITVSDPPTAPPATTDGSTTTADPRTTTSPKTDNVTNATNNPATSSTSTDATTDDTNVNVLPVIMREALDNITLSLEIIDDLSSRLDYREALDNITLSLEIIDDLSSRLDYISWYLVMVTSLLLLMNFALLVMVCCKRNRQPTTTNNTTGSHHKNEFTESTFK